jgi:hypothetical protein
LFLDDKAVIVEKVGVVCGEALSGGDQFLNFFNIQ